MQKFAEARMHAGSFTFIQCCPGDVLVMEHCGTPFQRRIRELMGRLVPTQKC